MRIKEMEEEDGKKKRKRRGSSQSWERFLKAVIQTQGFVSLPVKSKPLPKDSAA